MLNAVTSSAVLLESITLAVLRAIFTTRSEEAKMLVSSPRTLKVFPAHASHTLSEADKLHAGELLSGTSARGGAAVPE